MGAEHRLQAFHLRDDAAGIAQKILAVFGGRHTAGRALEQCDAKLRLQLPDVLAQVGLAHIQIFGCGGYGPRFGDLDGVAQLLQVHDVHLRNRYVKIDIGTIPIIHYPAGKESDKILTRDKGTAAPALLPQQPDPGALPAGQHNPLNLLEVFVMARFTLPRDLYHGKGSIAELANLKGKKAIVVVGGGSMKRFGFLDKVEGYLKQAGMEVRLFENVEPDPSVETVMRGAAAMREFEPDWIVAMGGGSPIDAAKAMWAFYEYPDTTMEQLIIPFNFPTLRTKARFCAIPSTSGTATEVTAFSVITDYQKGIKYPLADFNITPDVAIVVLSWLRPCPRNSPPTPVWTR